jgi:pyruvate, orthophosphate dikinase
MKPLLGGKGANLAEMTRIGLPVPPGFTITTEVCTYYYANKRTYPKDLQAQMEAGIANMEKIMGTKFGDKNAMPLLVAVRSGARDSMPGMMDTILNLGLNDETVLALVKATGNERFAWDCYRRFIQMYGDVVMGVQKREGEDHEPFEVVIHELQARAYHADIEDTELTAEDLQELVPLQGARQGAHRQGIPQDPWDQLNGAVGAVFGSWMNDRAIVYRRKYNIPSEWGTAVNVQAMVFGNTGENSGSGVAFTRNPANGEKGVLRRVPHQRPGRGRRRRRPHSGTGRRAQEPDAQGLQGTRNIRATLEKHFKDVQDFEFTIQDGKSSCSRPATASAPPRRREVRHGHGQGEAHRLEDRHPAQPGRSARPAARPDLRPQSEEGRQGASPRGLPAGPGAASGKMYLNADRAETAAGKGEKVLLVRNETSPEDLRGMIAAEGILTARAASVRTPHSSPARWARSASAAPARCRSITTAKTVTVDGTDLQGRRFPLDRRHRRRPSTPANQDRRRPKSSRPRRKIARPQRPRPSDVPSSS